MNTRTRTIASFFSVAMAAMLLGAVVTTQIQRPDGLAQAREPRCRGRRRRRRAAPGRLDHPRHLPEIARRQTAGVVNINTKKIVRALARQRSDRSSDFFGDDFMERFFGPQGRRRRRQRRADPAQPRLRVHRRQGRATILTNRHVIEGADEITVDASAGKRLRRRSWSARTRARTWRS